MTRVLGIDPGPDMSAFVLFDGERMLEHGHVGNEFLLKRLRQKSFGSDYLTVIEQIQAMGQVVGAEVFETAFWSGRFAQASRPFERLKRTAVKRHLCGKTASNDIDVRAALKKRFGGFPEGFSSHRYAALGVAVTWWDQQQAERGAA